VPEVGEFCALVVKSRRPMRLCFVVELVALVALDWLDAIAPHRVVGWLAGLGHGLRTTLQWGARHTGLPVVLFAAIVLVASWHLFRRALRFAVEVALAVVALLVATRLGWITW
jgi:hypothetical protein